MKDTLIEIKNNLQGNNSRVDEAENQINDLEYKEAKTTRKKENPKKKIGEWCKQPARQLLAIEHSLHRDARRREK